jgi:hypothetical protein
VLTNNNNIMDHYIITTRSYLGKFPIDMDGLLELCISEVKDQLDIKPQIFVIT